MAEKSKSKNPAHKRDYKRERQYDGRPDVKEKRAARNRARRKAEKRKPPKIEPVMPKLETSERVEKERQVPLFEPPAAAEVPPLSLLDDPPERPSQYSAELASSV